MRKYFKNSNYKAIKYVPKMYWWHFNYENMALGLVEYTRPKPNLMDEEEKTNLN